MKYFVLLSFFPILWMFVSRVIFRNNVTWKECGIQIGIILVIVGVLVAGGYMSSLTDTQILNGEVTGKEMETVSCSHSYSCPPCWPVCSGSGKNRSCSTQCSTCYEHRHDYNWTVHSNLGDEYIDRIDRQGKDEPPRWTVVKKGDPFAKFSTYVNYVKAAPDTLFRVSKDNIKFYADKIPAYPEIYDYYKANRVIPVGVTIPNLQQWNDHLSDLLKPLGPSKQANIVVVVVNVEGQDYRYALEAAWEGGKKNDIVVIIGAPHFPQISWTDTITLGGNKGNEFLQVHMRNTIMDNPTMDIQTLDLIATNVQQHFDRESMKHFRYLLDTIQPPAALLWVTAFISVFGSFGLSWFFYCYDLDNGSWVRPFNPFKKKLTSRW